MTKKIQKTERMDESMSLAITEHNKFKYKSHIEVPAPVHCG